MSTSTETRDFYLENTIRDCKYYLKESGKLQKDKIIQWANALNELGKVPTHLISGQIQREARDEFGWSEGQCSYIREVLPDEFKDKAKVNKGEASEDNLALENLNIKEITLDQLNSLDDEELRDYHKAGKVLREKVELVAKNRNTALVDHEEREDKVSTYRPLPGKSEEYYAVDDVINALEPFLKNLIAIRKKMEQFPNTNDVKAKENARKIRTLSTYFEAFNNLLPSIADEKWAFSDWKWMQTAVLEEELSKHGAAKKSGIEIFDENGKPTGKYRPLTRERVGDRKEELWKNMQAYAQAMDIQAWWLGLVEFRDIDSGMTQRIASRRDRIHDKLSDKAFGV